MRFWKDWPGPWPSCCYPGSSGAAPCVRIQVRVVELRVEGRGAGVGSLALAEPIGHRGLASTYKTVDATMFHHGTEPLGSWDVGLSRRSLKGRPAFVTRVRAPKDDGRQAPSMPWCRRPVGGNLLISYSHTCKSVTTETPTTRCVVADRPFLVRILRVDLLKSPPRVHARFTP